MLSAKPAFPLLIAVAGGASFFSLSSFPGTVCGQEDSERNIRQGDEDRAEHDDGAERSGDLHKPTARRAFRQTDVDVAEERLDARAAERREVDDLETDFREEPPARETRSAVRSSGRVAAPRDSRTVAAGGGSAGSVRAPDLGIWFQRGAGKLLIIDALSRSGAIAQFGFLEGDRIVSVNGQRVTTERDFIHVLTADDVRGHRVPVVVVRDGRRQLIYVRPELLITDAAAHIDPLDRLGVVLDDRYVSQLVVWRVLPRSPAYYAGIRPGDVIHTFDDVEVVDAGELVRMIDATDSDDVVIGIRRNQDDVTAAVELRPAQAAVVEALPPAIPRNEALDDLRPDPYSDRRLTPRPDVPPGMRVPGGEVGRERGPITPSTSGGSPTTPMRIGFPR